LKGLCFLKEVAMPWAFSLSQWRHISEALLQKLPRRNATLIQMLASPQTLGMIVEVSHRQPNEGCTTIERLRLCKRCV
jgi:hypothetical protein